MILYGIVICICILILIKIYIHPPTVEFFVNENRQLYFISFGGPTEKYHNAVTRVCKEAEAFDVFNHIIKVTDHDLKEDYEFWKKHGEFIEQNKRGYGYWIWKPYIIKQLLGAMKENDVLVYADAGCEFNIHGKPRLHEYIDMADKSKNGIVGFELSQQEQVWTKMDLIDHLDAREQMESKQIMGGVSIIRKCPESVAMVNKWYSVYSNYHLVDDSPSIRPNHNSFQEHRHDQSIFSILQKQSGGIIHKDEVDNVSESERQKYPIFAARNRG